MRRPALKAVFFFILGIILGNLVDFPVFILFSLLILLLAFLLYFSVKKNPKMANLFLIFALFVGGFFRYEILSKDFPVNHITHFVGLDRYLSVEGRVIDYPDVRKDRTYLTVEVEKISSRDKEIKTCGQILVRVKEPTFRFNYGDKIGFGGYINQPISERNPGAFDYRKYLANKRIFGITYLSQDSRINIIKSKSSNPYYSELVYPLRGWLLKLFDNSLSPLPSALMSGFLLGEVRDIPKDIYYMFRDTGTLHLLAVSGSNVGLVILFVLGFLRLFRIPRVYATIVTLMVIVIFANVVQNEPSVVRAGIMAGVALVGLLLYKRLDALNIVSFAALLILLYSPLLLFDVGFQLSFVSVFGIIYLVPKMIRFASKYIPKNKGNLWKWVVYPVVVSLAVQIVVIPILAYYFNFVPIITVVANLFIVPLASLSIFFGCIIIFLGIFSFQLAGFVGWVGNLVLDLTIYLLNFFAHLPIARVKVPSPSLFAMFNYYLILILLFEAGASRKLRKIFVFYLVLLSCFYVWSYALSSKSNQIEFAFLDVGKGQAALLKTDNNRTILFNAGGVWGNFDAGERVVVPYLIKNGIVDLDRVVVTDKSESNLKSIQSIKDEVSIKEIVNCFGDSVGNSYVPQIDLTVYQKPNITSRESLLVNFIQLKTKEETQSQFGLIRIEYDKISFHLLDKGIYQFISNLSIQDSCAVLVLPELDATVKKMENLIELFKPKMVLLTSYNLFEKKGYLLNRLKYRFPEIEFCSHRENGAVIFKTDGKKVKIKLTIKE